MPIEPGDSWFSPKHILVWACVKLDGGRALDGPDGETRWDQSNSEYRQVFRRTQSTGAKLGGQKGNNPDPRLRSLTLCLVGKEVILQKHPGGRLRSSHP